MNLDNERYAKFELVREMLEAPDVVSGFDFDCGKAVAQELKKRGRLIMTGEGSSRILPSKYAMYLADIKGIRLDMRTNGSRQVMLAKTDDAVVVGASNSGKTREVVELFRKIKAGSNAYRVGLTSYPDTPLEAAADTAHVLSCGAEKAVAATKSIIEQALFYDSVIMHYAGLRRSRDEYRKCADAIGQTLTQKIAPEIVENFARSSLVFYSGWNNGVAEEITLKNNEITRKKSDFLEGTYAVHGIEEVMDGTEALLWIDPIAAEYDKYKKSISDVAGIFMAAVATGETPFPTIRIPDVGDFNGFVQIAAGWNLLVEVGLSLNVDLDHPVRARKVGNELID